MINWRKISEKIMDFIDLNEENRPSYNKVESFSAKYFGIDRTLFKDLKNDEYADQLWVYEQEDKEIVLFKLFHECWHAYQKSQGVKIEYSEEDRKKYACNQHMMMLYKYTFEAEATGYASAFVYTIYKFCSIFKKECFDKKIEDSYTNVDYFPEQEFDTKDDYIKINELINTFYDEGKAYIKNQFNTSVSEEMKDIIKSSKINDDFNYDLLSKKAFIIYEIILELLK